MSEDRKKRKKNNELFESTKRMLNVEQIVYRGLRLRIGREDEERKEKYHKRKKVIKRNFGSVKELGNYHKVKQKDLYKEFNRVFPISEKNFRALYNAGLAHTPTSEALMAMKQFLKYNQNIEMIFLNPESEMDYEHATFFEIFDKLTEKIGVRIEMDKNNKTKKASILDEVLANYSGPLESENVVNIIKAAWDQFFMDDFFEKSNTVINQIENNLQSYSQKQAEEAYIERIEAIKACYSFLFLKDDIYKFKTDGKRQGAYNDIKKLSSGKIQKVCVENILRYIETVSSAYKDFCKKRVVDPTVSIDEFATMANEKYLENDKK